MHSLGKEGKMELNNNLSNHETIIIKVITGTIGTITALISKYCTLKQAEFAQLLLYELSVYKRADKTEWINCRGTSLLSPVHIFRRLLSTILVYL